MSITNTEIKKVKKVVDELIERLGVDLTVEVGANLESLNVNLSGEDSALLIGYHGDNLGAFSYILNILAKKQVEPDFKLKVDVGGYLDEKDKKIKAIIQKEVEKVKKSGFPETLSGLNAYERRLAHMVVEKEGLVSESTGFGQDRKLVIKPK